MNDGELKPLSREKIEEWIETLDAHGMPDWIQQHMKLYRENPEKGHLWDARDYGGYIDTPSLLLTTTGRKSGKPFTLPLLYGRDGDRCVIVGSKGGAPEHPAWYKNLAANPEVQVQVASDRYTAIARTITGPERDRLWTMMTGVYPPLASYQQCTDRLIPVVVLERKACDVISDQLTANFLKAAIVTLRNDVVPALSTPESRINADLVTRVLYMLESRFSRRGEDLKQLLAQDQELYQQIGALLAKPDANPEIPLQQGETFSAIEKLEGQVFQQEAVIIAKIPALLDMANKPGPEKEFALGYLRNIVDIQKAFLAAQDPDILKGSDVCYQGGRISEERPVERAAIFGEELTPASLQNHLQARFPGAQVRDFSPMAGGFSKTTIFFTLVHGDGGSEKLVIRKDIPTDYISSVGYEFPLLQQLHSAGFSVAEPRWLEDDPKPFGGRFMVSRRVEGSTDISRWATNPDMVDNFARQLAKVMADLHSLPLEKLGYAVEIANRSAGELMEEEIQRWYDRFKQSTREARPVIEMAVAWIKSNMPESAFTRPACLVHGDIGFHNLMIADGKVTALLDWEFSHPGDPVEDLMYVKPFVEKVIDWQKFKSYYLEFGGQPCTSEEEFFYSVWAKTRNPLSSVMGMAVFADTLQDNIKFASSCYVLARYLEVEAGYVILDAMEK